MLRVAALAAPLRATLCAALLVLWAAPARAGDLADEADLQFELGADRFRAQDYKGALEHFLASNRLVPNRNVVANIAATYAALKQYPEAFRYYTQAREAETDAAQKASLERALGKVAPLVAVLRVVTPVPGATVYIDRKDLGPRAQTPALLGFGKGKVTVLAEAEGFESGVREGVILELGKETLVEFRLARVTGTVKVTGTPLGALVGVEGFDVSCALPCELQLPPGRRTLQLRKEGFLPGYRRVEVPAKGTVLADFALQPVTGGLVVNTDDGGAAVEVDGKLLGFTPVVLEVAVGERRVKVSRSGYRTIEKTATVKAGEQARLELAMAPLEEVSAASRTAESLDDAPSSVTVISGAELRAMGYPTLIDALRGVRGVFQNDDRTYRSIGVRGFGPAGSYGNRVLILQDGHSTNDDWIGQSYGGADGRVDLGDLERIEIVRGPGSVLYGTGAFSGVFNLVSRPHRAGSELSATLATDEPGELRARFAVRAASDSAGFSLSASGLSGAGQDFFFPERVDAATGQTGVSRGSDGVRGGNLSLQTWWRDLTLQAAFNVREKHMPTGEYATVVGDPTSKIVDTRAYAELRYAPSFGANVDLLARAYADYYHYDSTLLGTPDSGNLRREFFWGAWVGGEARLTLRSGDLLRVMAGVEGQAHLRVEQRGTAEVGTPQQADYLNQKNPFQLGAGYLLADLKPTGWLHLSAGARYDTYSTFGSSINPRLALILRPYQGGVTKLMAGKSFRAPSIYELYYNDGGVSQISGCNPVCGLRPETLVSGELEHTHRLNDEWSAQAAVYLSRLTDLIALRAVPNPVSGGSALVNQYGNTDLPVRSVGGEVELRHEWRGGFMASAWYALQKSSYQQDDAVPAAQRLREVPNSPIHMGGLKLVVPVVGRSLRFSTRLSLESARFDTSDHPDDAPQGKTDAGATWDLVFSGDAPEWHATWSAGFYNVGDWKHRTPVSVEFAPVRAVQEQGRGLVAQLTVTY